MEPILNKVLIVEDNPGDVVLLATAFREYGKGEFELTHAGDLDMALKLISKGDFDAILLDLSLPLFYGLEPLARIHRLRSRIPIFILSGYNDPELAAQAVQIGAKGYIVKNRLESNEVVDQVRAAIEHRKLFSPKKD